MPKTYADQTPEQRANFEAELQKIGFTLNEIPETLNTTQPLTMHSEMSLSSVPGMAITIRDLAHMKELGGVPDTHFQQGGADTHVQYPVALEGTRAKLLSAQSGESLAQSLTGEERQSVAGAVSAFVNGNSERVPQDLVQIANTTSFPMEATAFAAQNLVIDKPFVIEGPTPQVLVFGTVTIKPGGSIIVKTDAKLSAQVIVNEN